MTTIAGRTAIVTGGASGIGLGIARQLVRAGAQVAIADIRAEAVEEARRCLAGNGPRVIGIVTDVSDRTSVEAAADRAEHDLGPLSIAVNNAGVAMHGMPLEQMSSADWDWVIGVNVYGVIHGIQCFVPRIRRNGVGGHVVNTASVAGFQVRPGWNSGAYATTKYAVVALSEALAIELDGSGIGVSVLCPAAVSTGLHRSGRSRPDRLGGATERPHQDFVGDMIKHGMAPDMVGARVVEAIERDELFVFTHTPPRAWIEERHGRIMQAFNRASEWEARVGAGKSTASS
jgi:NAD(P)-dependent dehydrogenase (short-subunit alcohol dehydrogenase family)